MEKRLFMAAFETSLCLCFRAGAEARDLENYYAALKSRSSTLRALFYDLNCNDLLRSDVVG